MFSETYVAEHIGKDLIPVNEDYPSILKIKGFYLQPKLRI